MIVANKLVEVKTVHVQHFQQSIRLLGTIHSKHATVLLAKGSGTLDTLIPSGQKVKKGTLIATIANGDAENNLKLSFSATDLAKTQLDRINPLLNSGFVSAKEIAEKKQAWIEAQKELSRTKIERDNLRFYAPFDGIVGAYKKRDGSQVNQGEPIVTIYDPSSLTVDFDIPCGNLTELNEGQPLTILGKNYTLTHLQKMLDEDTHMCPGDVDIHCDNCLLGSTVAVDLVVADKPKALVVPVSALFLRDGKPYVYTVEDHKIILNAIARGLQQKDTVEISGGLKPGQQVVTKGQDRLYPQMIVDIYHPEAQKKVS